MLRTKVFAKARLKNEGSVLRETMESVGLGLGIRSHLQSRWGGKARGAVVKNAMFLERNFSLSGQLFEPKSFSTMP